MRYIDGIVYYTVSEVAAAAGVSAQSIRLWEKQGELSSRRTAGGHRLFDEEGVRRARQKAASRRRAGEVPDGQVSPISNGPIADWEIGATGARIKAGRLHAQLSQKEVATRADISRSMLSAVERGETGVSMFVFEKLAKVLGLAASDLAPKWPHDELLIRAADRPRTVLADGVTWEEMTPPGRPLSVAYLSLPPLASSGGVVTDPLDAFVTVLKGRLEVSFPDVRGTEILRPGDGLTLQGQRTYEWRNDSARPCLAIWVAYDPERR